MPALDEQIVRRLTEMGPLIEGAIAALLCIEPRHANAALIRLRASGRICQADGVHWEIKGSGRREAAPKPIAAPAPSKGRLAEMLSERKPPKRAEPKETRPVSEKKTCPRCNQSKSPSEMNANGLCKACKKVQNQEWRDRQKEGVQERPRGRPRKNPEATKPVSIETIGRLKAVNSGFSIIAEVFSLELTDSINGIKVRVNIDRSSAKALAERLQTL